MEIFEEKNIKGVRQIFWISKFPNKYTPGTNVRQEGGTIVRIKFYDLVS